MFTFNSYMRIVCTSTLAPANRTVPSAYYPTRSLTIVSTGSAACLRVRMFMLRTCLCYARSCRDGIGGNGGSLWARWAKWKCGQRLQVSFTRTNISSRQMIRSSDMLGRPRIVFDLAVEPTRNTVRFSHTRDTIGWPDPTVLTLEDAGKYLFQAFDSQVYLASAAAAFLRRNGRDVGTFARGVAAELFGGNRNQTNDLRDFFFFLSCSDAEHSHHEVCSLCFWF